MELYVLSKDLVTLLVIDDYISVLWVERYCETGDFEIELPIDYINNPYVIKNNRIFCSDSDRVMIIEQINPAKSEDNDKLVIKGTSIEKELQQRVTRQTTYCEQYVESFCMELVDAELIRPTDQSRVYPNLEFVSNTSFQVYLSDQYPPSSVYDIVQSACSSKDGGFKITLNIGTRKLQMMVYKGVYRTYDQYAYPYVVFSEAFDNVTDHSFLESVKEHKNVAMVISDDPTIQTAVIWDEDYDEPTGNLRREMVVDATDLTRDIPDSPPLTDGEFLAIMYQRGLNALKERVPVYILEGEFDMSSSFKYGEDFFLGDVVQCGFYGKTSKARLIEIVRSVSAEGSKILGSFDFNIL